MLEEEIIREKIFRELWKSGNPKEKEGAYVIFPKESIKEEFIDAGLRKDVRTIRFISSLRKKYSGLETYQGMKKTQERP